MMGHECNASRRKRRRSVSVSQVWLLPLMERFYEPNKPAIVAAGVVLLPFCIRLVLPSLDISNFVLLHLPLKESLPDLSDVIHSWLTPPMLFLLLNLVIGTIAVTSIGAANKDRHKKSSKKTYKNKIKGTIHWNAFGKYGERFEEVEDEEEMLLPLRTPLVEPANPLKKRPKSSHESPYSPVKPPLFEPPKPPPSLDVGMNKSEAPTFVKMFEVPPREGLTSYFEDEVDDDISPDDQSAEELNAKADDFIQKFKQELFLQRLRSFRERKRAGR